MAIITMKKPEDVNDFPTADGTYNLTFSNGREIKKSQIQIAGQVVTFTQSSSPSEVGKNVDRISFLSAVRDTLASGSVTLDIEQIAAARTPQPKDEPSKGHSWWWIAALVGAAVLYHSRKKSA
jgi:hypothetical protein